MQITADIAAVRGIVGGWRQDGQRIVLVPTMGNLHAGHLRLVEHAKVLGERVVATIFVNPMQFDRTDDLAAYPRTFDEDRRQLEELGVDILFRPEDATIYPLGKDNMTRVEVPGLSDILCGASRPGHFVGVTTVVAKLFNIVYPDVAVFGEKDYQQLMIIRRLAADLNMPVEVVGTATVREPDGLAMSSRNNYLTKEERLRAGGLYQTLQEIADRLRAGSRRYAWEEREGINQFSERGFKPDFVYIRRAEDLTEPGPEDRELVILAAAFLGKARLIDNLRVTL